MTEFVALPPRARDDTAVVAGVCAGLALRLAVDATLVRLVFALLTLAGGAGIVLYLAAALLMPEQPETRPRRARTILGLLLLLLTGAALLNGVGLPAFVVAAGALGAFGAYLIVRSNQRVLGWILVAVAAATVVGESSNDDPGHGPSLAPGALVAGLLLVVAPWLWRTAVERDAERTARIRSEERAEIAARVHDSVLQTLALIQKDAGDPRRVATLARRQERELRGWLFGPYREGSLVAAVDDAANDIEELHGVRVEVATAGNAALDDDLHAVVLAAREAMANAAKFSGVETISVYVEVGEDRVSLFVRDRGIGFDRASVGAERRGLAESIEARMARHGGSATITSVPGEGTEVELTLPRKKT